MPPTQSPLRLDAEILSRMRSEVTSRSNWANDSSTFRVSRPIEVVVLNCWVTETKDTLCLSNSSTSLAKSANERGGRWGVAAGKAAVFVFGSEQRPAGVRLAADIGP